MHPEENFLVVGNLYNERGCGKYVYVRIDTVKYLKNKTKKIIGKSWILIKRWHMMAVGMLKDIRNGNQSGLLLQFTSLTKTVFVQTYQDAPTRKSISKITKALHKHDPQFKINLRGGN